MSETQCCENPPTLSITSVGIGCVAEIGGLKAYITGPPDAKLAVLLVSDVFGYEARKLRKLADKVASCGFYVVVPDFFYGDPYVPDNPERPIAVWRQSHGTKYFCHITCHSCIGKGFEDAIRVVSALRSEGVSAIGAAGFCWGAKVVVELGKSDYIQAAVLLHPSRVTVEDIKEVKAPIAVLGAEYDKLSPPELLKQFEEILSAKPEVDGCVKIFAGVEHGWTVRYKDEDAAEVKSAEEAHKDMLDWFNKHLK
ncbi:endo-1,3;1,4-beta-D-glucanase [Eucalyptus grandis]|uniref:endo-1,3;1,4-beta-D-glucanase n=1 Tax=Eucalyptus grandis TaxID=71139 RepID=UPI00192EC237|nr:endo-1,3;1,4-beta-D-glucanase [Eucalyptus grandis]